MQSTYDKLSDVAHFDSNMGPQTYPSTTNSDSDFVLPDGETVVGVLNDGLSTQSAREGDRFMLTVRHHRSSKGLRLKVTYLMFSTAVA